MDISETSDTHKPKSRWLQYSLRTLLLLTSLVAVCLAMLANRAHQQRNAVAAIRRIGGSVTYHNQIARGVAPVRSSPKSPWPRWLRSWLGQDFFVGVDEVLLRGPKVTDADLVHLRDLRGFNVLILLNTPRVTDMGLKHLEGMTSLRMLWIEQNNNVTDEGLSHLIELTGLESLSLDSKNITDTGIQHLNALTKLRDLYLSGTKVGDLGLRHLELENLSALDLSGTMVTDAGVRSLSTTKLDWLCLSDTQLKNGTLAELSLHLPNCEIKVMPTPTSHNGVGQVGSP